MMKSFATLVRAAAAAILLSGAASAAPVNFSVGAGSGGTAVCSGPGLFGPDSTCNFTVSLESAPSFILDSAGDNFTFDFLRFTASGTDLLPDNFIVNAVMAFTDPLGLVFGGTGGNDGTLGVITFAGRFLNANLIWDPTPSQVIPGVGIVSLALANRSTGLFDSGNLLAPRNFVVEATVSLQPIPLPAGILLLGSALLGLFGLSRRRKLAAA